MKHSCVTCAYLNVADDEAGNCINICDIKRRVEIPCPSYEPFDFFISDEMKKDMQQWLLSIDCYYNGCCPWNTPSFSDELCHKC